MVGWWITYFFFQLPVFISHLVNLDLQPLELILFLESTFESTFTVLKKPSLSFAHVGPPDFLFNLIELTCSRPLRSRIISRVIGERINVNLLARSLVSVIIEVVLVWQVLIFQQLVHRGILFLERWSIGRAVFSFPFCQVCFGLRTILVFFCLSVLTLTRL